MEKFDVDLAHLEVSEFEGTGRGVRALKDIKKGELIISMPIGSLITRKEFESDIYILTWSYRRKAGRIESISV